MSLFGFEYEYFDGAARLHLSTSDWVLFVYPQLICIGYVETFELATEIRRWPAKKSIPRCLIITAAAENYDGLQTGIANYLAANSHSDDSCGTALGTRTGLVQRR